MRIAPGEYGAPPDTLFLFTDPDGLKLEVPFEPQLAREGPGFRPAPARRRAGRLPRGGARDAGTSAVAQIKCQQATSAEEFVAVRRHNAIFVAREA
jgi:hypothetical protein